MKAVLFDGSKDDDTTIGTIRQAIVEQLGRAGGDEEAIDVRNKRIAGLDGVLWLLGQDSGHLCHR